MATPMPPPMHRVARPFLALRRPISCSRVTSTRAPEAPIGWPMAMAPPFTFTIDGFHQPVVYEAGTVPSDIEAPPFPPEENIFVTPPAGPLGPGQLDRGPLNEPPATATWTTDVFDTPGRYLVICNITPHFGFFKMYGWVVVE